MGEPRLPSLLVAHHRPGFYLRVLTEGHVRAGDEIVRTARGPHALSVADVDALLYLPGHDVEQLRAALDIPALSPGWRESFRSMVESDAEARPAGIAVAPPPAWAGFRTLTVTEVVAESDVRDVVPVRRGRRRCRRTGPASSSPSACRAQATRSRCGRTPCPDDADAGRYRISVKRESHGLVSAHLHAHLHRGDRIEVAAPRGDFVLDEGAEPVLLVSAGIGQTPLLAMLHRLASGRSSRGGVVDPHHARRGQPCLLHRGRRPAGRLPSAHSLVYYTAPAQPLAPGSGVRAGTTHRGGDHGPGSPDRRGRVRLRPGAVHGRRRGRPRRRRRRSRPASTPNGSGRGRRSTPASSGRTRRRRTSRPGHRAPARR